MPPSVVFVLCARAWCDRCIQVCLFLKNYSHIPFRMRTRCDGASVAAFVEVEYRALRFAPTVPTTSRPGLDSMATHGTKNEKDLAKAAAMKRRSIALTSSVYKRQLDEMLKTNPELILPILSHCKRIKQRCAEEDPFFKLDPEQLAAKVEQLEGECASASSGSPSKCSASDTPTKPAAKADQTQNLERAIDRQATKVSNLPVCDLKTICIHLQPIAFSLFNLRGIAVRGNRTVAQERHCELIEFDTGVPGSAALERRFGTIGALAEYLKEFQAQRGNRGSTLRLPPDWSVDGVYLVVKAPDGFTNICNRFSQTMCRLPEKYQVQVDKLSIYSNFSEERAEIRTPGALTGDNIAKLMLCAASGGRIVRTDGMDLKAGAKTEISAAQDSGDKSSGDSSVTSGPTMAQPVPCGDTTTALTKEDPDDEDGDTEDSVKEEAVDATCAKKAMTKEFVAALEKAFVIPKVTPAST